MRACLAGVIAGILGLAVLGGSSTAKTAGGFNLTLSAVRGDMPLNAGLPMGAVCIVAALVLVFVCAFRRS